MTVELPRLSDFAWLELALSFLIAAVWMGVMWRSRSTLVERHKRRDWRTLLFLVMLWATIGAFIGRSVFDLGVLTSSVAVFIAGIARFVVLIVGLVLWWLGPPEGSPPK